MSSLVHLIPDALTDSLANGKTERLLTVAELADWLGVSKAWVYDHIGRKQPLLSCLRLGELTRFRREDIELFIEKHAKRNGSR
jgi:excisionase family DNA binding protein